MVDLATLAQQCGEWLRGSGPESDIVISSRIRLARNFSDFPFIRKCSPQDRSTIEQRLRDTIDSISQWSNVSYIDVDALDDVDQGCNATSVAG